MGTLCFDGLVLVFRSNNETTSEKCFKNWGLRRSDKGMRYTIKRWYNVSRNGET